MTKNVMLNWIQHPAKSQTYETLKSLDPETNSGKVYRFDIWSFGSLEL